MRGGEKADSMQTRADTNMAKTNSTDAVIPQGLFNLITFLYDLDSMCAVPV